MTPETFNLLVQKIVSGRTDQKSNLWEQNKVDISSALFTSNLSILILNSQYEEEQNRSFCIFFYVFVLQNLIFLIYQTSYLFGLAACL